MKLHVIPLNDQIDHICTSKCWCSPSKTDNNQLIIHNSLDGRESVEQWGVSDPSRPWQVVETQ